MSREPINDAELNALLLCGCFGWRWVKKVEGHAPYLTMLRCGEEDPFGYVNANYFPEHEQPSDASAPRFTDWDRCCFTRGPRGGIEHIGIPNFCQDRNLVAQWLFPLVAERQKINGYLDELIKIIHPPSFTSGDGITWACMTATPRQQAEAVARVLGLWPATWDAEQESES